MARITKPAQLEIPMAVIGGQIKVAFPIDVPEGGFLQIVAGESLLAPPVAILAMPRGSIVAFLPPDSVLALFPGIKDAPKEGPPLRQMDPPGMNLFGLPLVNCAWIPGTAALNVVVGENPQALPVPSTPLPAGCLLGLVPPEAAERVRQGVASIHQGQNPYAIVPGANGLVAP